jgi:hypothetical protein
MEKTYRSFAQLLTREQKEKLEAELRDLREAGKELSPREEQEIARELLEGEMACGEDLPLRRAERKKAFGPHMRAFSI